MTGDPCTQDHIEDLVVGHFDGSLTAEQEKELADALTTSAEAKQVLLSYMRMEGRLHSLGRDGFLREPVTEPAGGPERSASQQVDDASVDQRGRQPASSLKSRLLAASTSLVVCAAVILLISFWVLWPSSVSASSVLRKAQQAAAELIDRTYRVTLSDAGRPSQTRQFTVDVRGGGRFVVRPVEGAYVMGCDGSDFWATRPDGPVWVTSDFRSLKRRVPARQLIVLAASPNEPLLLDMDELIALIERKYDVELVDSANVNEHHVRATLRSGRRNDPALIDFWADAGSGVGRRAEIEWSTGRQMRFELLESTTRSDQWYHHSEHAPGGAVERLDAVQSPQASTRQPRSRRKETE